MSDKQSQDEQKRTPTELDEFLGTARKRFEASKEEERHLRDKFIEDLKFASPDGDEQWDTTLKQQREAAGRPAMSFPRCHTFVQQVSNEARQKKPQIKFAPRLDQDKDTAECLEGMARYIQYDSQAQVAYETAIEYSAGGSFGYYRFLTDYCSDDSDDLELKVVPVLDPLTVYGVLVPACFNRKVHYAFVVEDVPKDEYKAQYGDSEMASLSWADAGKRDGWVNEDSVRIAEYWYVEETKEKGKRRPKRVVKFCKTNGMEILADSETTWPGSTIPIIAVLGKQMIMEGQPRLFSVVRPQKAAQQMINFAKSRIAETLQQSPVSPFIAVRGQITAANADAWKALNTRPQAVLEYEGVDLAGRPAPPPQRQVYEPPIAALSAFVAQEVDDLKATTGIFDASLGNQANETSGRAILARKDQSNLTTMHYIDNLGRSFKQAGDIIAECVPLIYDTERQVEILGEDEKQKVVTINKEYTDESGKTLHYRVKDAKMSYVVTMAQAFDSKRMESFDTMQQVLSTSPNLLPMVGDIFFRNSDLAGADQLAERFHKMLPPQLQDQENPLPPEAQAQVAQAQQQAQLMQGEMQKLQFEKAAKETEHQGKMQQIAAQFQADMMLAAQDRETKLAVAEISTKAQSAAERQAFVEDLWKQFHNQAHDLAMQKDDQAHQAAITAQQAAHQQDAQAQQADATSQQSAQDAAQTQAAQEAQPSEAQ